MPEADPLRARIEAFGRARGGGVVVRQAAGGYALFHVGTGGPIAWLRPTGDGDEVRVLWWNGERWGASGPFGIATMPLDWIAAEPAFWIYA